MERQIECPDCGAFALNKYGKTSSGKQKYRCLVCGRQFSLESMGRKVTQRPCCPHCGNGMHIYRRENGLIRFRCAKYPQCRGYAKTLN